jgi:hypothetical protein
VEEHLGSTYGTIRRSPKQKSEFASNFWSKDSQILAESYAEFA